MLIDFVSPALAPAIGPFFQCVQNSAPFVVFMTMSKVKIFDLFDITTFVASPCIFHPLFNSLERLNKL